jgi:hypothetical protein
MKNFKFSQNGMLFCLVASIFMLSSAVTLAQKTNYAGSWTMNEVKSPTPENGFRMGAIKFTATQDDQKLILDRTYKGQDGEDMVSKEVYTMDGKVSENTFFQTMKRKSTVAWSADGKILTINSVTFIDRDGETMEMKSTEVLKLSSNGAELTVESTLNTPNGDMKSTIVYDKAK